MIKSFEGVRGLAAVLVALFHLYSYKLFAINSYWFSIVRNGYVFVDLFFVMSGFIIASSYSERLSTQNEIKSFIVRRFGRLFPLLVFATISYVVVYDGWELTKIILKQTLWSEQAAEIPVQYLVPSFYEILSTVTMTHGLGVFNWPILNYATWSISAEFYTYLLFALCFAGLKARNRLIALAFLCIACLAASIWASVFIHKCLVAGQCGNLTYDFGFVRCVGCFILGIFVYRLPKPLAKAADPLQVLAVTLVAMLFYSINAFPLAIFASPIVFAVLIYSLSTDSDTLSRIFGHNIFQMLGQRSYSIYLLHPVILLLICPVLNFVHRPLLFGMVLLAYIPIVAVCAGWTYRNIEDPMRKYFNSFVDHKQGNQAIEGSLGVK